MTQLTRKLNVCAQEYFEIHAGRTMQIPYAAQTQHASACLLLSLGVCARAQIVCFAKPWARVAANTHTEDDLQPPCLPHWRRCCAPRKLLIYASFISFLLIIALPLLGGPFQRISLGVMTDGRTQPTENARKHILLKFID